MQEVRDLTTVLSDAITFVRQAHANAKETLAAEVIKARANVDKVNSMTQEFKKANLELEAFIGNTASNFPPLDEDFKTYTGQDELRVEPKADINGVTLKREGVK
jgi:hypothetical protein